MMEQSSNGWLRKKDREKVLLTITFQHSICMVSNNCLVAPKVSTNLMVFVKRNMYEKTALFPTGPHNEPIVHFAVTCLVAKPLNRSEAKGDLVMIQTLPLFKCR